MYACSRVLSCYIRDSFVINNDRDCLQRLIYTLLTTAQELLFGKKLVFDWQLGDNWALKSMEILDKELAVVENDRKDSGSPQMKDPNQPEYVYRRQIVWFNTIGFLVLHLGALYGLYLFLTSSMVLTMLWSKYDE